MNYLMRGTSSINPTESRGRDETVHVDDMYRLYIYNKARTIEFSGYVPENFNFGLSNTWSAPFSGLSIASFTGDAMNKLDNRGGTADQIAARAANRTMKADVIDKTLKMSGLNSMHKLTSARVWTEPSYLTFELPIFLDAYSSTDKEVVTPMIQMLSMAAPDELGGFFVPPGPVPSKSVVNGLMNAVGASNDEPLVDDNESFTMKLGSFFTMTPCIITNVSGAGDASFEDATGNPISADFMITVESYFAVTRKDLAAWFHKTPASNLDTAKSIYKRVL